MDAGRKQNLRIKQKDRWAENELVAELLGVDKCHVNFYRYALKSQCMHEELRRGDDITYVDVPLLDLLLSDPQPRHIEFAKQLLERLVAGTRDDSIAQKQIVQKVLGPEFDVDEHWDRIVDHSLLDILLNEPSDFSLKNIRSSLRTSERRKLNEKQPAKPKRKPIVPKVFDPDEKLDAAGELRVAMWYIKKLGDPERALQVLKAAVAATKALEN